MSSNKRLPGFRQFGFALDKITKPMFEKYGHVHSRLLADWEKIVGEKLAQCSRPVRLHFYNDKKVDGVLVVEVYHSAFATNMMFMEPVIIEKIATYFGYKAVGRLKIVQKPSTRMLMMKVDVEDWYHSQKRNVPGCVHQSLATIEDDELRSRLGQLYESMNH